MSIELVAAGAVDFQWTTHTDGVWQNLPFHLPALHAAAFQELVDKVDSPSLTSDGGSPLGIPLLGLAGAGKTHLLSALRQEVCRRGAFFLLVDMTGVRSFDETLLLGALRSLGQRGADGRPQWHTLLEELLEHYGDDASRTDGVQGLAAARPPELITRCDRLLQSIRRHHAEDGRQHQDVLRALILLASDDFALVDLGYAWLQGDGIGAGDAELHGFRQAQQKPQLIFRGLSWLMSLARPTVLALDQLDAVVAEHNLMSPEEPTRDMTDRQSESLAIIQGLAGGLLALRDITRRTEVVVSCLEVTWAVLDGRSTAPMQDRFEAPVLLRGIDDPALLAELVEQRLRPAYAEVELSPPYPCYPFPTDFFTALRGASPRELFKRCAAHLRECVRRGVVVEADAALLRPVRERQHRSDMPSPSDTPRRSELASIRERFEQLGLQPPSTRSSRTSA